METPAWEAPRKRSSFLTPGGGEESGRRKIWAGGKNDPRSPEPNLGRQLKVSLDEAHFAFHNLENDGKLTRAKEMVHGFNTAHGIELSTHAAELSDKVANGVALVHAVCVGHDASESQRQKLKRKGALLLAAPIQQTPEKVYRSSSRECGDTA
jgi:hypothetical protein